MKTFHRPGFLFIVMCFILPGGSCNKSSGIHENKAFVTVTQTAPGSSPIDVLYDNASILGGSKLAFDQTTGTPGNPYVQATAGVRVLTVKEGTQTVLEGNTAFQQGLHYSLFVYDTLKNDSLRMFILQDNLQIRTDTFTYVRFINFAPGSYLNLLLTSKRDTVATGFLPYAGDKLNPSFYLFRRLHIGRYAARAFVDTLFSNSIPLDSLYIDSTKIYTVFFQGFPDSTGAYSLKLKSIRHN
ncbi:MAG: DUF4397 domain-containing protein [Bacteroidota bacterium]|nr:DUF4397 domain-containing protein [Bacteroidota bacterium]